MKYFLDIAGVFLYLFFRISILPIVLALYTVFTLQTASRQAAKLARKLGVVPVKPTAPLFRFIRLNLHLSK